MPRGSKPGERRGGRQKGTPNRSTVARIAIADKAAAQGITPLEVMMSAMRSFYENGDMEKAVTVAASAAPYMHPRLSASSVDAKHSGDMTQRVVVKIEDAGTETVHPASPAALGVVTH
jgi:hypothetical protein